MEEKRLYELLTRKLAGEASKDDLIELNELLLKYPEAASIQDVLGEIWNSKVEEEGADFFYKRHKRKFEDEFEEMDKVEKEAEEINQHSNKNKYFVGAICTLLFLVIGAYLFLNQPEKPVKAAAYTEIISGKGVRKFVTLPDGTRVWLNADSKISFDPNIKGNISRAVDLEGEAYFDVVHIDGHPFIIHTKKVSIKVLGTAFNVKAYPNDKKCETTLIRGSIELITNDKAKQKFILKPSEKLSVIQAATKVNDSKTSSDSSSLLIEMISPVKLSNKEYVPETSWTENKLIFENESLDELAPKLERWFNVKIDITAKSQAGYRFTGAFANETIEQALTAMRLIKPFNFKINDKNITIY